jgi:hypothetical protein
MRVRNAKPVVIAGGGIGDLRARSASRSESTRVIAAPH